MTLLYQACSSRRVVSDSASCAFFSGSSMMTRSAGLPVPEPPRPMNAIRPPRVVIKLSFDFDPFWKVVRSEEHTSELQSLMRISYAVFCLKKKKEHNNEH